MTLLDYLCLEQRRMETDVKMLEKLPGWEDAEPFFREAQRQIGYGIRALERL